jgi:hypothetical protein
MAKNIIENILLKAGFVKYWRSGTRKTRKPRFAVGIKKAVISPRTRFWKYCGVNASVAVAPDQGDGLIPRNERVATCQKRKIRLQHFGILTTHSDCIVSAAYLY